MPCDWSTPGSTCTSTAQLPRRYPMFYLPDRSPIVALRKDMPIRDEQRAETEPQHSRTYSPSTGGWTEPTRPKPTEEN
jgi:hypothetical protein